MPLETLRTLFHPFEVEALSLPKQGERVLFLGAEPGSRLPEGFSPDILAVQGFRPSYLALQREGCTVVALSEGENYDCALVLASRHRSESELRVAEALPRVRAGGLIVVAGAKDDGIASLRKQISSLVPIEGQLPKYHGVAFWLRRPQDAEPVVEALRAANPDCVVDDRFHVAPGMFSASAVDRGSKLLTDFLPADIKGAVADFCAGWGYLGRVIADRFTGVSKLDLYEADFASLEAARHNLDGVRAATTFFWHDLAIEEISVRYDVIVMNPPFHVGRGADPAIGESMIRAAAKALKRGGRLFMVANRQLPYEQALAANFSRRQQVFGDGVYKVFCAWK